MSAEELAVIHQARLAADELLERYLHIPLRKAAIDLGTPRGFDQAVATLATRLREQVRDGDEAAVAEAIRALDVDWRRLGRDQRRSLITRALDAARRRTDTAPRLAQVVLADAASEVVEATRELIRDRQGLAISAELSTLDHRLIRFLRTSQSGFIRDEYGRRLTTFESRARRIVADGLKAGLGQADIASNLHAAARATIAARGRFYWEVVASSFVGTGRSFAQVSAYAEAGIERYVIEAVLDERTTEVCRFLHGKTFEVGDALRRFDRLEQLEQPEAIRAAHPWVREGVDPGTGSSELFINRGDERVRIAEVARPGFGRRDERGEYGRSLSDRELADLGISFPPFHALCRSVVVPAVT